MNPIDIMTLMMMGFTSEEAEKLLTLMMEYEDEDDVQSECDN